MTRAPAVHDTPRTTSSPVANSRWWHRCALGEFEPRLELGPTVSKAKAANATKRAPRHESERDKVDVHRTPTTPVLGGSGANWLRLHNDSYLQIRGS